MVRIVARQTSCPSKKAAISDSVTSKAKFPMKAVYGGLVGNGRSAREEPQLVRTEHVKWEIGALTA